VETDAHARALLNISFHIPSNGANVMTVLQVSCICRN
jgi:hypothetical protein